MTSSITYSNFKIYLDNHGNSNLVTKLSNSLYRFRLPQPIILGSEDIHRVVLGVESCSIPLSFYAINETNNQITLNGTTYFIAEGNYNVQQLLNTLNNETLVGSNITVSFSDITAKITFTSSSLWTIAFNNDTVLDSGSEEGRVMGDTSVVGVRRHRQSEVLNVW
jgi:hypothetical protein